MSIDLSGSDYLESSSSNVSLCPAGRAVLLSSGKRTLKLARLTLQCISSWLATKGGLLAER